MKSTGVVRRIDDLGRVVIPKEIRKVLRIKEGAPLEIFTDKEGEIILKKYSPIGELSEFATSYAETIAKTTGHIACITDTDTVIAVGDGRYKGLFYSKDKGHTWHRSNITTGLFLYLTISGSTVIVGCLNDDSLYYSDDKGKTWEKSNFIE